MRRTLVLLCAFVMALPAFATTGYMTISGSHLADFGGNLLSNATISWAPVNNQGQAIAARVGSSSGSQAIVTPVSAQVVAGVFSLTVADTSLTNPVNVCFSVMVTDNSTGNVLLNYPCAQPASTGQTTWCTSSACNFDNYVPGSAPGTTLITGPQGATGAAGPGTITGFSSDGTNGVIVAGNTKTASLNGLQSPEYINAAHPPLAFWSSLLHSCTQGPVAINVHGDSRSVADTTTSPGFGTGTALSVTFGNRWVDLLFSRLVSVCGSHGTGFVPFRWHTGSFASEGMNQDYYATSGTFTATDTAIGPYQPNLSDPMVVTATSNGATITFTPYLPMDHLAAACVSGPGLNAWTMKIDGTSVGTCGGSAGSKSAVRVVSSAVTIGPHVPSMVCATQPCEAYGMQAISGITGIEINNLSISSGSAEAFGFAPSTQYAFSDLFPNVALDIIYEVTNEPGQGYSTTQFQTTLNNMIAHDRALTFPPSILIFSPLQDSVSGQGSYYPILASTALAQGTDFVDLRDRWGTSTAPSYLMGPDTIHESNQGNGEVASAVVQKILDADFPLGNDVYMSLGIQAMGKCYLGAGLNLLCDEAWGNGNGAGLPGVRGLFDYTTGHFVWNTNATDDLYGYTPLSGANVAAGTGSTWHILHGGQGLLTALQLGANGTQYTIDQSVTVTGSPICTATASSSCLLTVTWPHAFADTNYLFSCYGNQTTVNGFIVGEASKGTTSVQVAFVNVSGSSGGPNKVQCRGWE